MKQRLAVLALVVVAVVPGVFGALGSTSGGFPEETMSASTNGDPNDVAVSQSHVYVANSNNEVRKYNSSGSLIWTYSGFSSSVEAVEYEDGFVYAGDNSETHKIEDKRGSTSLSWSVGRAPESLDVDSNGNVYISTDDDDTMYKYDSSGSHQWTYSTGGPTIWSVRVGTDESHIYIGTDFNDIRQIQDNGASASRNWAQGNINGGTRIYDLETHNSYVYGVGSDQSVVKLDDAGNKVWEKTSIASDAQGIAYNGSKVYVAEPSDIEELEDNGGSASFAGTYSYSNAYFEHMDSDPSKNVFGVVDQGNDKVLGWGMKKSVINFTVEARDAFDGQSLQNFTANLTGQTTGTTYDLNTTTGTITTPVLSNSSELWDVNVSSDSYFDEDFANINVSENTSLTASLDDNRTRFTQANTKITNDTLTDFNITIQGQTFESNNTFASPDRYNATFSKAGWFNKTREFNATLNNTFNGVYDAELTVDLDDKISGNDVQNYTATVKNTTYNLDDSKNTTSGSITFDVVQNESYNVTVDSDEYPITSRSVFVNTSTPTETFSLLEERTAQLTFKDTTGNSLITQQVNYTLTPTNIDSGVVSGNTKTGSANETLLEPASYRGQAESSGFEPNTFFFTIRDESINDKTVYLTDENKTSPITVTVLDQATNPVRGVKVRLQRFYTNTSSYNTITASQTDSEGQTTLFPPADRAYYKFSFNRDNDVIKITNPQQLLKANFQFTASLGETQLTESKFYQSFSRILSYDEETNDFKAVIDQSGENNKVCLVVERTGALRTKQINKTCTTSTTATLLAPRDPENVTYTGKITLQRRTELGTYSITVEELTKSFSDIPARSTGLIAQILLILLVGIPSVAILPTLSPVIIGITLALGWWIGLTTIGLPAVMAILVTGVTATIAARTR